MNPTDWIIVTTFFTLTFAQFIPQVQVAANTPTNVRQCSITTLTWLFGEKPYNVRVNAHLDNGGVGALLQEWQALESTSVQWQVNVTASINAVLSVQDAEGFIGQSAGFKILPGTIDCMNNNRVPPSSPPSPSPSPSPSPPPSPSLPPVDPVSSSPAPSNEVPTPVPSVGPSSPPPPPPTPSSPSTPPGSPSFGGNSLGPSSSINLNPTSGIRPPSAIPSIFNSNSSLSPRATGPVAQTPRAGSTTTLPAVITTVIIVPCFVILGFGIFCWRKKRRRQRDAEDHSVEFALPTHAMDRPLITHSSSLSSTSSSAQSTSTPMGEFSFTPLTQAANTGTFTTQAEEVLVPISRGSAPVMVNIGPQQGSDNAGIFSQDPGDPSLIRLDPHSRHAQIALRYQAKLHREMGLDNQPSASFASPMASHTDIPESDMRAIVESMRAEIEHLRAQQVLQLETRRFQTPPPPSYDER